AEEWLEVSVGDDGTGFDPARSPRGMGLDNLEARATRNGGELQLESSPGVGTSVIARLPV
ncbi:MAG: sensor histidine kinase, partial [Actinobacteria bacterium]|nr:sensor histidine kinase [Actinomycetota bacterium]NIS32561.1 sensor histidine kinase [Actinomycetota bacterium]NIT96322.1 sensor histidine kinase [Actinomycetota bacterium]NIU20040.1 sensor histidine kinase [Actinomycetota bacterium]NIU67579.1 sensor histidine kinase [Actinomycetota bacterium]